METFPKLFPTFGSYADSLLSMFMPHIHHYKTKFVFALIFQLSSFFYYSFWLGLHCCGWAFSSCGKQGLLSSCNARWASHCSGLSCCKAQAPGHGLGRYGARAYLPHSMWDFPRPWIEPVSLALSGGFFTTGPPVKPSSYLLMRSWRIHIHWY